MRMMGADSVEYHRQTVIGRADDFAGQARAYYSSRGETPLVWGGSGAARLGLAGSATDAQYAALYGPGGASDPTTGARWCGAEGQAWRSWSPPTSPSPSSV
jgi:hypothetical protein